MLKEGMLEVGTVVISKHPITSTWTTAGGTCSGSWHYSGVITSIKDKFYEVTWHQDTRDTHRVLTRPSVLTMGEITQYYSIIEEPIMQETTQTEPTFTLKQIEDAYSHWNGAGQFADYVAKFHDPEYQQYLTLKAKFG